MELAFARLFINLLREFVLKSVGMGFLFRVNILAMMVICLMEMDVPLFVRNKYFLGATMQIAVLLLFVSIKEFPSR